ncbi:MAG: nucleotidyltransferase domain-containing protein [Defluviitaleaceae bacterium]|nr:nucleotidyltransferase domain-containing protein [Defluviitaleaceae bacterium]
MPPKLFSIDEIKSTVTEVAKKYGIAKAYLFGSYAKGIADTNSDIDLRIDKGQLRGLFQLSGFKIDLQERLGTNVDVVTTQSLEASFLNLIRNEEVVLYEQGS